MNRKTLLVSAATLAVMSMVSRAQAQSFSFGVMSDTQWSSAADAANNPGTVAKGIIDQLNQKFIQSNVKFVVQVGDLCDREANYSSLPQTPRIGLSTRAAAAQPLYDAGIGFYPLRGNHEGSSTAAGEFQGLFPQTTGTGSNVFGAANFSSPSTNLQGLSYSFDYGNSRFVLLDQFTPTDGKASDGSTYSQGNNAIASQQTWIGNTLSSKPSNSHAFVFSHKQLFGGNHTDTLFNTAASNAGAQNAFISSLDSANVGYLFSGHDHMHNRSVVTSPDGASQVNQVISASDSYKFYTPVALTSHGTDAAGTGYPNAGLPAKNRETELAQELWSTGYYIVTVDGPRTTVDFYSADPTPGTPGLADVDLMTTPNLSFVKRETFGYSLNGKQKLVAPGQAYAVSDNTAAAVAAGEAGYVGTSMSILNGSNNSTLTDYNARVYSRSVNTGWKSKAEEADPRLHSDVLSLWGVEDLQPWGTTDPDGADPFVLSMTYDSTVPSDLLNSGYFGLRTETADGDWVLAVALNTGGNINFVGDMPYDTTVHGLQLGTYGYDSASQTVWAVVNHGSNFAAAVPEPATLSLGAMVGAGILLRRRRK